MNLADLIEEAKEKGSIVVDVTLKDFRSLIPQIDFENTKVNDLHKRGSNVIILSTKAWVITLNFIKKDIV